MTKICMVTDIHFGHSKNSEHILEHTISFFVNQLIPELQKQKINKIVILGDIFDCRVAINTKVHHEVYKLFFKHLHEFEIYVLIGNHDTYYTSTIDVHSLQFLDMFKNVTLIDKPQVICINNTQILMMPWITNIGNFNKIVNEYDASILIGHLDIIGFNFNKHVISKDGLSPEQICGKFDMVFSGHYHTRSVKDINGTKFIYVGSPCQFTRADMDEERGYLIYDTDTREHEFVTNNISSKFIELNFPEKFSEYTVENNFVDVIIEYTNDTFTPEKYNKYIENVVKMNPAKITPVYINSSDENKNLDIKKKNMSHIPNLMKNYVDTMTYDKNKDELYESLERYYKLARG